jgi:hypothetical protein
MDNSNQIIMYTTTDGKTKISVKVDTDSDTVWLTQAQLAELFQTTKQNVSLHVVNIFKESELDENSVVKDFLTTAADGKSYNTKHYNLDVIISVGYRIKSLRGTQFRQWATKLLREYIIKGFTINDELLKKSGGGNYYKELLERIRDIRSDERVVYRQVLDLFATSIDYDGRSETARLFFKQMQNKFFYATNGQTAAEIISGRANADLPFMGLTVFRGGRPTKSEVTVAKNYLSEKELMTLNRIVSAYFDLAEINAIEEKPMYMKDWLKELDGFIEFRGRELLKNSGKVSRGDAVIKAENEYEKYKQKPIDELNQVEKDFLQSIKEAQRQIERSRKEKINTDNTNKFKIFE